jgi:hypothetical protein
MRFSSTLEIVNAQAAYSEKALALNQTCDNASSKKPRRQNQAGQIVVEYVLLLLVAVGIAAIVTKSMIGTDKTNPGFVISAWQSLVEEIGKDHADDIER